MSSNKKHIVWITPGFAANENDTSCIPTLQDLAKCFAAHQDIELTIVSVHYPFKEHFYKWNTLSVHAVAGQNKKGVHRIKTYYHTWMLLKQINLSNKINLIHSFWIGDASLIAQYFCSRHGIKHVTTIMGQDALGNSYFKWTNFNQLKLVSLTPYAAQLFKKASGLTTAIMPFGLPVEVALPQQQKTVDLLNVGSIIPLKNQLGFLKIVHAIKKTIPGIKAIMTGEQYDKNYLVLLTNFIAENDLPNNVQIIDKVSREHVLQIMATSKILVHTSDYESQGMVMQEALANGCKVFSTGNGFVSDVSAFEILQGNIQQQAETIARELSNYKGYSSCIPIKIEETYLSYIQLYKDQLSS